jgi:hypothetical protein
MYMTLKYPFRLTGANEPIIRKHISNVKKFGTKILHVHSDILCSQTNFQKERTFFCVPYKKDKFLYEHITICIFLSFLPMSHKMFIFCQKLVWGH